MQLSIVPVKVQCNIHRKQNHFVLAAVRAPANSSRRHTFPLSDAYCVVPVVSCKGRRGVFSQQIALGMQAGNIHIEPPKRGSPTCVLPSPPLRRRDSLLCYISGHRGPSQKSYAHRTIFK
jgi:hypothetical protein